MVCSGEGVGCGKRRRLVCLEARGISLLESCGFGVEEDAFFLGYPSNVDRWSTEKYKWNECYSGQFRVGGIILDSDSGISNIVNLNAPFYAAMLCFYKCPKTDSFHLGRHTINCFQWGFNLLNSYCRYVILALQSHLQAFLRGRAVSLHAIGGLPVASPRTHRRISPDRKHRTSFCPVGCRLD